MEINLDCKVKPIIFAVQLHRGVEQLVARRAHNPEVVGSSPASATAKGKSKGFPFFFGPRNDSYPWKWAFWWIEGHINGSYPQKQPFSWTKLGVTMVIGVSLSKGVNVGDIDFFV